MKKLTQITKKIFLVLICTVILGTAFNTNAVASSIELGGSEIVPGYVSGVKFTTKTKTDGTLLYCLNMNKRTAKNITANLVGELDTGVAYIMVNGYPNKTFTGDKMKDYYITQTALWWYLDNTTGSSNLSQKFKTTGSDPENLRPTIKSLVAKAEQAKKDGNKKTSLVITTNDLSMSLQGDYYVSNDIYAKTYSNITNYKVSVSGASGAQVIDANGNEKTTIGVNEKFKVRVPASAVTGTELSIKVVASATGVIYKAYKYEPTDPNMQPITPSIPEKIYEKVESSLSLTIDSSRVRIVKIDEITGNAIAGATLVLKDANGEVKAEWTSSTNYRTIRNLPNGTYTVTETAAPEGYILDSTPVKFTITDTNRDIEVKIKNKPRESVVNILKVDASTGNPLAGAVLVIKNSQGEEIKRFTTTNEPEVFTDLANGTYTVEEIQAPAGYMLSSKVVTFTITDQNLSHQVIFENHPEVRVPDTAASSIIITLLGIVVIASGVRFVYKNGKKAN